ncbi:hypothetical protein [uncultured Roseobacter sp.]|uniref:hypothetical protein n=1 Tax=uncultured Roseobacter sp. TaxID=114847 RepID=UPI0026096521|nr:hypothetical protein [uncultured Roseobacter sp.]
MRSKIIGALFALIGLLVTLSCMDQSNAPGPSVEVTRAELDAALATTLAQSREVDFPEKTRFEALRFRHVAGLGIEGRARFFDPVTGGYPPPDIRFFGSVPMGWWRVEDGALTIKLASVDGIEPIPGGAASTSQVVERIRDSLGTGVGDLLSRMSFATGLDPDRRWIIASGQSTPEALRFELWPR